MSEKPENQSAFPLAEDGGQNVSYGMTLRDYFAASALHGLGWEWISGTNDEGSNPDSISRDCYRMADAMLKARMQNG